MLKGKTEIMETKGRRSLRASGATEAPAVPLKPVEDAIPANGPSQIEPPKPAELLVEAEKPTETGIELVDAAGRVLSTPSIGPLPPVPKGANRCDLGKSEGNPATALA